jgi:hypothetical protein
LSAQIYSSRNRLFPGQHTLQSDEPFFAPIS